MIVCLNWMAITRVLMGVVSLLEQDRVQRIRSWAKNRKDYEGSPIEGRQLFVVKWVRPMMDKNGDGKSKGDGYGHQPGKQTEGYQ